MPMRFPVTPLFSSAMLTTASIAIVGAPTFWGTMYRAPTGTRRAGRQRRHSGEWRSQVKLRPRERNPRARGLVAGAAATAAAASAREAARGRCATAGALRCGNGYLDRGCLAGALATAESLLLL